MAGDDERRKLGRYIHRPHHGDLRGLGNLQGLTSSRYLESTRAPPRYKGRPFLCQGYRRKGAPNGLCRWGRLFTWNSMYRRDDGLVEIRLVARLGLEPRTDLLSYPRAGSW